MMQKVSEEERVQLKVKIELLEREKKMAEDRLREEQEQKLRELEEKNRLEKERLEVLSMCLGRYWCVCVCVWVGVWVWVWVCGCVGGGRCEGAIQVLPVSSCLQEKDNLRQELAALKDEVSLYSQYHVDFCTVISNNLDLYFY